MKIREASILHIEVGGMRVGSTRILSCPINAFLRSRPLKSHQPIRAARGLGVISLSCPTQSPQSFRNLGGGVYPFSPHAVTRVPNFAPRNKIRASFLVAQAVYADRQPTRSVFFVSLCCSFRPPKKSPTGARQSCTARHVDPKRRSARAKRAHEAPKRPPRGPPKCA